MKLFALACLQLWVWYLRAVYVRIPMTHPERTRTECEYWRAVRALNRVHRSFE